MKTKYVFHLEARRYLGELKDMVQRNLIRDNPSMTSDRFQEDLEELKQKASEKERK